MTDTERLDKMLSEADFTEVYELWDEKCNQITPSQSDMIEELLGLASVDEDELSDMLTKMEEE